MQWEYATQVLYLPAGTLETAHLNALADGLNGAGKQGWELCEMDPLPQVQDEHGKPGRGWVCVYKRPVAGTSTAPLDGPWSGD